MKQKTIVFTEAYKAELLEVEIPVPGPGQVRVKLAGSTIRSGTERANLVGDVNVSISGMPAPCLFSPGEVAIVPPAWWIWLAKVLPSSR